MKKHKPEVSEIRELLRRGDPAADGREPDDAEISRVRARMLSEAARESAPGYPWRAWGLAGAAAVLALAIAGWALNPGRSHPEPMVDRPDVADGSLAGKPEPTPIVRTPDPVPQEPIVEKEVSVAAATVPPQAVTVGVVSPGEAQVRPARQVQLRGPGGTKILWKLDPEFKL